MKAGQLEAFPESPDTTPWPVAAPAEPLHNKVVVPKKGLEPPHPCGYMDLNHARLPIPPLRPATALWGGHAALKGKRLRDYSYKAYTACQTSTSSQARKIASATSRTGMPVKRQTESGAGQADELTRLRALAHDLSNSLEAILQATYLLGQAHLEGDSKRWLELIDSSSQEAARINREIRKSLRALTEP
jgi:hypothetical protein